MTQPSKNMTHAHALCLLAIAKQLKANDANKMDETKSINIEKTLKAQFCGIITEYLATEEITSMAAETMSAQLHSELEQMVAMIRIVNDGNMNKDMLFHGIQSVCSEILEREVEI